jgi:hypothetical protein
MHGASLPPPVSPVVRLWALPRPPQVMLQIPNDAPVAIDSPWVLATSEAAK